MAQVTPVTALGLRPPQSSLQVTKKSTVEQTTQPEICVTQNFTGHRTPRPSQHADLHAPLRIQPRTQEPSQTLHTLQDWSQTEDQPLVLRRKPKKLPNTQTTPADLLETEYHRWN